MFLSLAREVEAKTNQKYTKLIHSKNSKGIRRITDKTFRDRDPLA